MNSLGVALSYGWCAREATGSKKVDGPFSLQIRTVFFK